MCMTKKYEDLKIFPCLSNQKIPATINGFKDAGFFNINELIKAGYNIGLPMASNNLIAIDMDYDEARGLNGSQRIAELEKELGTLTNTYTQATPRGGVHKVFSNEGIINPKGKIGKDVDIKHNGYVMLSPSSINGKYYQVIDGIDKNGNLLFAKLSKNWLRHLNKSTTTSYFDSNKKSPKPSIKNVDFEKIFQNCAYLRHCRDFAEVIEEPQWFTMIGILANTEDGDALIHELSSPYPNYSFEETQKKIEYAQNFGYSQTCAYISSNYPEVCGNCPSALQN